MYLSLCSLLLPCLLAEECPGVEVRGDVQQGTSRNDVRSIKKIEENQKKERECRSGTEKSEESCSQVDRTREK
jgi:hypothetical protein